ncbi:stage II sporulation protein D [Vulcanibacillus modesticaldus]|uniref:Stage II sporulation protein D n=1 Tax=Vulcanibacillus modesticaldus TaxID=337097 RepID=A0A1D2YVR6_9BACI|nr:stage II sporulation protein D [Vulcanibacillus modesticaldus]OEF99809.1 stage II sporulation protein D [Vulcanibacillus modesticaldus]
MKPIILLFLFLLGASMILIPIFFVIFLNVPVANETAFDTAFIKKIELELDPSKNVPISVYRANSKKIETYPLEEYVRGVVAAEMPTEFELEALKAQAIAARTYIVKRIAEKDFSDVPEGAVVSDTVKHQVFLSDDELKKIWGIAYTERISKINKAINETIGQVITYQGKPIDALFFSTSNGYTENSEDYFEKEVPYLRSVASPWDNQSPKFQTSLTISYDVIKSKLNVDPVILASTGQKWIEILETTAGKRVKKIRIGDKILSGRQIRELFNLSSSSFTFETKGDEVVFYTKGYGHGVGMSQYGANGMAKEGRTAQEIIKYYYTGVEITDIGQWIKPVS